MKFPKWLMALIFGGILMSLAGCAADESKGLCSFLGACDDDDDDAPAAAPVKRNPGDILEPQ
jgi:hypothetical protein